MQPHLVSDLRKAWRAAAQHAQLTQQTQLGQQTQCSFTSHGFAYPCTSTSTDTTSTTSPRLNEGEARSGMVGPELIVLNTIYSGGVGGEIITTICSRVSLAFPTPTLRGSSSPRSSSTSSRSACLSPL